MRREEGEAFLPPASPARAGTRPAGVAIAATAVWLSALAMVSVLTR
jgi:hypothetical protein